METRIYKSELNVLEILWQEGDKTAKQISLELANAIGWNKATTYTIIKRCVEKGFIQRLGFDFTCHATITKKQAEEMELDALADKMFQGSTRDLMAAVLRKHKVKPEIIEQIFGANESIQTSRLLA